MSATPVPQARLGPRDWLTLLCATAAALVLRVAGLGRDALWFDESYRVLLASRPPLHAAATFFYLHCSHPPLYLMLLRAWIELFGDSELSVRMPSIIAGTALVPITFAFARAHASAGTARLVAIFTCASPVMLYYSQDASMYAMLAVTWIGVLHFQLVLHKRATLRSWIGFTLCLATSLLLFDLSLILIPASAAVLIVSGRTHRWRWIATGSAVAVALYGPHFFAALHEVTSEARSYLAARWRNDQPWTTVLLAISGLLPGGANSAKGGKLPPDTHLRVGVLFFFLLAVASALLARPGERRKRIAWVLLAWTLVPIACLTAASLVKPIWDVGRHETAVAPALLILAASGVRQWSLRPRALAIGLFLALEGYSLRHFYTEARPDFVHDSRGVARFLADSTSASDLIVFLGYAREPVEYQMMRLRTARPYYSFPRENEAHHGWVTFKQSTDAAYYSAEVEALSRRVKQLPPGACVWLVGFRLGDQMEKIGRALLKAAPLVTLTHPGRWRLAGYRQPLPEQ
ncbi:MAG: glycosyltransferase family 39 protein [Planctomycetota bacterium]